jgi:hypothetical protein
VRLLLITACGLALELGWLALWPLASAFSQSPNFTSEYLGSFAIAGNLAATLQDVARVAAPELGNASLLDAIGHASAIGPTLLLVGVMLWLGAGYLAAVWLLARGAGSTRGAVWLIVAFSLLFQVTALGIPGLFSRDVFGYAVYGRLAVDYGLNPYIWPPSAVGKDPAVAWVAEVWQTYACPYGPLWLDVQSAMTGLVGGLQMVEQALAYRLLASVLLTLCIVCAWFLFAQTGNRRVDQAASLAALAWNPLLIFEFAGNAHNDILMIAASVLGGTLLMRSHRRARGRLAAAACFTCGALVKYLSIVGVVWMLVATLAGGQRWSTRVRNVFLILLVSCGMVALVSAAWLELPDSLDPLLNETVGVGYVNFVPDLVVVAVSHAFVPEGADAGAALASARTAERALTLGILCAYLAWEVRRVWRDPSATSVIRASVRSSLVYILVVSTSVQVWYFALPLALAALLGWRSALSRLAIGYTLVALPVLYASYYLRELTPMSAWLAYWLGPPLVIAAIEGWKQRGVLLAWLLGKGSAQAPHDQQVAAGSGPVLHTGANDFGQP